MSFVFANMESQLKPPIFDVLEEHWQEFSSAMRAVLGGQHGRSQQLLDAAEAADTRDLSNTRIQTLMGDEGLLTNKKMYVALVMTTKGSAQMIVRGQERHNGAVCWRALCKRFEPATAVRAQSLMQGILNVGEFPGTIADFEEKHGEWERSIPRYELASGESCNTWVKKVDLPAECPQEPEDPSPDAEQSVLRGAGGHNGAVLAGQHGLRRRFLALWDQPDNFRGQPESGCHGSGCAETGRQGRQEERQGQRQGQGQGQSGQTFVL